MSSNTYTPWRASLEHVAHSLYLHYLPEATLYSAVYKQGSLDIPKQDPITVSKVLFDTGALHSSYLSISFFEKHKEKLLPFLKPHKGCVRLADGKTFINTNHVINLPISFVGNNDNKHSAIVDFTVFPNTGANDIILGLPDIIFHFSKLHMEMIENAVKTTLQQTLSYLHHMETRIVDSTSHPASDSNKIQYDPNLIKSPWSQLDSEAIEDIETPLPSSFPDALHFMEMSYEEAVEEFYAGFDKQVDPKFAASTKVIELLKTKGVKVFVPQNWEGINGIPLFELEFREGLPQSMKPKARPINPKLFPAAQAEFQRLCKYFYVPSNSPIASCIVIAPKATKPFIRYCGDYVLINQYIIVGHYPIPNVQYSLEKILKFRIFLDIDLANAFHQIRIGRVTSARLSVQTPWGQVEPLFMPEGIGPATGKLQQVVSEIFAEFDEWCIAIFDNLLVLAYDYDDAYRKLEIILDKCIERNVYLKFSKSWLGFQEVKFFGYVCSNSSYKLADDRKAALQAIPFPTNTKQMQSFLGAALFFKNFIPHYSTLTAPLNDMTRKEFNWDPQSWTNDYVAHFNTLKKALQASGSLFFPNYEYDWILRTDASSVGVGAVLIQIKPATSDGSISAEEQPISFATKKFSDAATRWSTIEQEAYAIYFAVTYFAYYLRCKPFILETDHNNLLWMEASTVPKIVRWRVLLQSFTFQLRHIRGVHNTVADWLSRIHFYTPDADAIPMIHHFARANAYDSSAMSYDFYSNNTEAVALVPPPTNGARNRNNSYQPFSDKDFVFQDPEPTPAIVAEPQIVPTRRTSIDPIPSSPAPTIHVPVVDETNNNTLNDNTSTAFDAMSALRSIHSGRSLHPGVRRTWLALNYFYPGHRIPHKVVEDFVASCPICQKDRLRMNDSIQPINRHLKPAHARSIIGVDTLTVTPTDKFGNTYLIVVINLFTKLVGLYPSKLHDAVSTATAIFQYFCTFGLVDGIISDPGSEFMNEVLSHLLAWLGIRHTVSLVDRHQSNGVEATNREILRLLKALVFDERLVHEWSSPIVLPLIQFHLNSSFHSESGCIPFEATFGSADARYFSLPSAKEGDNSMPSMHAYISKLNENLETIRKISYEYQQTLATERTSATPLHKQNVYQQDDLVLYQRDPDGFLPTKLSPKFIGPYAVISQYKNDVTCKHVIMGDIKVLHVSRLKIFTGSLEEAKQIAMLDNDQYVIDKFIAYRGDPETRTTMEFEIKFQDGSIVWQVYSKDISETLQFEDYCRSLPQLHLLLYSAEEAMKLKRKWNSSNITDVKPGDEVFVDLRCYNSAWYETLQLPDMHHITYVVLYVYKNFSSKKDTKRINVYCPTFRETFLVKNDFIKMYGSNRNLIPNGEDIVLIDEAFIKKYPQVLPSSSSKSDAE